MIMKKTRKILLLLTLVILLAGIASANEVSEDTTSTTDTYEMKVVDNIQEVSQTNTVTDEKNLEKEIRSIAEDKNNKTLDKNVNRKNTKEATANDWNTLNSAIVSARQATSDTTITLQNGYYDSSYTTAWMNNNKIVLTIDGNGQTIYGNGQMVFYIQSGCSIVLKNIVIKNSHTDVGAIFNEGNLTIIDAKLEDNTATYGAAIHNVGTVTITNSIFNNNIATYGGVINNNNATVTITNSILENNKADDSGGAINNYYGNLTLTNTTLENSNANVSGGAISNYMGIVTVTNSTLNSNIATYGGVINNNGGNVTVTDSTLENNNADDSGGVINNFEGNVTVTDSTLENNNANVSGGAINNLNATVTITDSMLDNNYANSNGGAINNYEATVTVTDSTLENNNANVSGGAINNYYGNLTVTNTTLENNYAKANGGSINNNGGTVTVTNSILENNSAYDSGGVINNFEGTVKVTDSTLENNNAICNGGAVSNYDGTVTLTNNILNKNNATEGGALFNNNGTLTITGNLFADNHANNKETIVLAGEVNGEFRDNTYEYTDINLTEIKLNTKDNKNTFSYGENVILNYSIQLANHDYYKDFEDGINDITLYINDEKNITTKYENSVLFKLKPGSYTVYFTSCNQQSNTLTFNVVKQDIIITCDSIKSVKYNDNVTITGKFTDVNGKAISNSNVNVYINGKQYKARTDSTGKYILTAPVKAIGKNNVTVSYGGNDYYNSYAKKTTFTAGKQNVVITINNINNTPYADNVTITGKFTDKNGKAISNSNVNVYINGKQYKARTDSTGKYILTAPVKAIGKNNVTVSYGGNSYYNSYAANKTFTATKQNIIISYDKISNVKKGKNVTITGKFTDKNGKAISNSNVNVYINGKQYKARTDSTGKYTLTTTANIVGTNNVTLSYGGNAYYNSYKTSTTFNVLAKSN